MITTSQTRIDDLYNQIDEADTRCLVLKNELDAYKAHVAELKSAICECLTLEFEELVTWDVMADKLLKKTPAQSLDSIKVQAINDLIKELSWDACIDGISNRVVCVDDAEIYAAKIGGGE